jgi:hypothetical protein
MPAKSDPSELEKEARFIFEGTVVKLKAATMTEVPVSPRTAVVRVDQIIQAPPAMRQFAGREITVELSKGSKAKPGQKARFYTNGWLFGESLAVQSIGQAAVQPVAAAAAAAAPAEEPARAQVERDLKDRVAAADVVVAGRVAQVRLPAEDTAARAMAAAGEPAPEEGPISEHDPLWQEAVIQVDDVIKGSHQPQTLVVRFPASTDVRWHKAPKFHPGQEGVWVLNKEQVGPEGPVPMAAAAGEEAAGPTMYAALSPLDYQPPQHLGQLKRLVEASQKG